MGKELEEAWEARSYESQAKLVFDSCKRCEIIKYKHILDEQGGYCQSCLKAVAFEKDLNKAIDE